MADILRSLPRDLGNGLLLRWGVTQDAEALAEFNVRIHSDNPDEPELFLAHWTRDLMRGDHPTTGPGDFTLVIDTKAGDKIVSSLCTISQRWCYEDIDFGVGRPELVGTDPDYRRLGLVRQQMEIIHAVSEARGEAVQAITGIPWYYRLFGYEMALDLGGSRLYPRDRLLRIKPPADETLAVRSATAGDISLLQRLYARHCEASLVSRIRDETLWRYELNTPHEESGYHRRFRLIETADGQPAGYFEYIDYSGGISVREMAAWPGRSLRQAAERAVRYLRPLTDTGGGDGKKPRPLAFALGAEHPAYEALGRALSPGRPPYAWYLRVPDLPGFLRTIAPVLERRLADSVLAGHSGTVRLNFFTSHLTLIFEQGRLADTGTYEPKRLEEADAAFPDLTFLQLLFGYRSLADLEHARADCYVDNDLAAVLLNILFPARHSQPVALG